MSKPVGFFTLHVGILQTATS